MAREFQEAPRRFDHQLATTAFALSDLPQNRDALGYDPYVLAMAQLLASDRLETPFTISIYGRWGTGKSTFMHLLAEKLTEQDVEHFMFHPWQFDEKEDVWKALIFSVIQYLEKRGTELQSKAEQQEQRLRKIALAVGKLAIDKTITAISGGNVSLEEVLNVYAKASEDNSKFINRFRDDFQRLRNEIFKVKLPTLPPLGRFRRPRATVLWYL